MSEARVQSAILEALKPLPGCVFWRNNVGAIHKNGRTIRFGLCVGSCDIIGIVDGKFAGLEVKVGAPVTEEQKAFMELVRLRGGVVAVVHDVPGAIDTVTRWRREIAAERGTL